MLTLIEDLPQDVVGVRAHGKVTAEDYERVLVPAVDAVRARAGGGGVRLLYVLGHEVPDYTAGAAWADAKLGLGHLRCRERIAIVGDAHWLRHAVHGFGWLNARRDQGVRTRRAGPRPRVGDVDAARPGSDLWRAAPVAERLPFRSRTLPG